MNNQQEKQSGLKGTVIREADRFGTVLVEVVTYKMHSKYQKRYRSTKKYKVYDPNNKCVLGKEICFSDHRPISKEKKFVAV